MLYNCLRNVIAIVVIIFVSCTPSLDNQKEENIGDEYFGKGIISDIPENIGVQNALKKAAQMRNITWEPKAYGMPYNNGFFQANTSYSGIPYSSVLEYCQYVFLDVSVETFATAVNNPRSVLYTENVSKDHSKSILGRNYIGYNSACYYGSTCSYLIVYALGLPHGILASEFPFFKDMEVVEEQSYSGVKLADVLSSGKHVSLVTDIKRDRDGVIQLLTVTENAWMTTRSIDYTPTQFDKLFSLGYTLLRYKYIEKNTNYTAYTDFVAVEGEIRGSYSYNEDICPNYGNKSNYVEGDTVVLNITSNYKEKGYKYLKVIKNNNMLYLLPITDIDIYLKDLSYGDYQVCLTDGFNNLSQYSFFKVVNMSVSLDNLAGEDIVSFASKNATPLYYDICEENGLKGPSGVNDILTHVLTTEELSKGRAILTSPLRPTEEYPYIKVHFTTEYGRTIKTVRKSFN